MGLPRHSCLVLIACLVLLTGCAGSGSPPPGVSEVVFGIVVAVWKLRKMGDDPLLRAGSSKSDYFKDWVTPVGDHVKFFLRWRAEALLKSNTEDQVKQLLAMEYDQVRIFVDFFIGRDAAATSTLIRGTDDPVAHLDFKDVLRVTDSDSVDDSKRLTHEDLRWKRAMSIVWRAAALENDLWTAGFSEPAMKEILDRRLRITERMLYQVSLKVAGPLVPDSAHPHGPWIDGARVRMFEYPFLGASNAGRIGAGNIADYGAPTAGKVWSKDFTGGLLYYAEGNGRRIRPAAVADFVPGVGVQFFETYPYDLMPAGDPGQAVDRLFTPSSDFWDRSWVYCDHVLSALHIESLRFGKRRRTGNDTAFNTAVTSHSRGWAEMRPLFPGRPGDPRLMSDDASKPPAEPRLFSNGPVPQVQLGDHVVFWNSIMYGLLSDGAWSLENAIVVDLVSDWASNDVGDSITLMGHGTDDVAAGTFREQVTAGLDSMIGSARDKAKAAAGDNTPWLRVGAPLVKWAPFGETWTDGAGPQDPWWIRIPYTDEGDWGGRALGRDATLGTIPDAIEYDPAAGFTGPPPTVGTFGPVNAAYFPLWVPAQEGKWKGYVARRKAGQVPTTFRLAPMRFDKANIPGLIFPLAFVPGATHQQVLTVRPIVVR